MLSKFSCRRSADCYHAGLPGSNGAPPFRLNGCTRAAHSASSPSPLVRGMGSGGGDDLAGSLPLTLPWGEVDSSHRHASIAAEHVLVPRPRSLHTPCRESDLRTSGSKGH